jgi:hypothetical protein
MTLSRRTLLALASLSVVACRKGESADRCSNCGMKIDPKSPWRALLVTAEGSEKAFDTPRCALAAWRRGKVPAVKIRVQEFYDRTWLDGDAVRFVVGSDVPGPMGPDLVPVDATRAEKFLKDHEGQRALALGDITAELIEQVQ